MRYATLRIVKAVQKGEESDYGTSWVDEIICDQPVPFESIPTKGEYVRYGNSTYQVRSIEHIVSGIPLGQTSIIIDAR